MSTVAALLRELSWPELRHHPWRHLSALVAVMLGVALAFSVQLINQSALAEFASAVRTVDGQPDFELRSQRGGFDEALYARVAAHPRVSIASPVVEIDTVAADAEGRRSSPRRSRRRCCRGPTTAPTGSPCSTPARYSSMHRHASGSAQRRGCGCKGRADRWIFEWPAASRPQGRRWR